MSHFRRDGSRIVVEMSDAERTFLSDVLPLLAGVGAKGDDPAADRLNVPVYLADGDSNDEWWRLMGPELVAARSSDRSILTRVVESEGSTVLAIEEADALLRVINEARLVLGARLGIDVESDYEDLAEHSRQVMGYLGHLLEELTVELMSGL